MNKHNLLFIGMITALLGYLSVAPKGQYYVKRFAKMVSDNGIKFLQNLELFSSKAYWDVKGWSIGYGHFMGANKLEDNISLARAIELMKNDLNWVEKAIKNRVHVTLNQNQYDALVSFVYNVGDANFASSSLLTKINASDFVGASHVFSLYNKIRKNGQLVVSQSLVTRREKERALFVS